MKQAGIQQQLPVQLLGPHLSPVHVHHVGDKLEGVEGDADGQNDFRDDFRNAENGSERSHHEPEILEYPEDHQTGGNGHDHAPLPPGPVLCSFDHQGAEPADRHHQQQKKQIPRPRPSVENEREREHRNVLLSNVPDQKLGDQIRRQEQKHEQHAGKYHGPRPLISLSEKVYHGTPDNETVFFSLMLILSLYTDDLRGLSVPWYSVKF